MDQLYLLRAFVTAAKHRSFTKAAASLGITTGAISKAISRLEADVHTRLFHRTTRSITLTEEAQSYYLTCCRLLEELDEANRCIMHERDVDSGRLHLVVHPMLVSETLFQFVAAYRALAPNVNLTISVHAHSVNLYDGCVDLAILPSVLIEQSTVIRRTLSRSPRVLVASRGYLQKTGMPTRAVALQRHFLLLNRRAMQEATGPIELLEDGTRVEVAPSSSMEGDDALLRVAALTDGGIAMLPEAMVREDLAMGRLIQVLPGCSSLEGDVELCLFYSRRELLPARLRTFVDFCIEYFRSDSSVSARGTVATLPRQTHHCPATLAAA